MAHDEPIGGAPIPGLEPQMDVPEGSDLEKLMTVLGRQNLVIEEMRKELSLASNRVGALEPLVTQIDTTTKETNGKVKKLRGEMDSVLPDRDTLMRERKNKIVDEEIARLRRDNLLVLPRTVGSWLIAGYHRVLMPTLKFLGVVVLAWPVLHWLWQHRIFWGN